MSYINKGTWRTGMPYVPFTFPPAQEYLLCMSLGMWYMLRSVVLVTLWVNRHCLVCVFYHVASPTKEAELWHFSSKVVQSKIKSLTKKIAPRCKYIFLGLKCSLILTAGGKNCNPLQSWFSLFYFFKSWSCPIALESTLHINVTQ